MKTIEYNGMLFELQEDYTWTGPTSQEILLLNEATEVLRANVGPADGDPRQAVFEQIVEFFLIHPDDVVDDEPQPAGGEGVVY